MNDSDPIPNLDTVSMALDDLILTSTEVTRAMTSIPVSDCQSCRHLEYSLRNLERNLDDFYFVVMTTFTFAMQCGFTFMEAGLVRSKNTTNILLKSTMDAFVGCICYWLIGFAISWGEGNSIVGWNHVAFDGLPADKFSFAFYQLIFANTASTIVSGAVAERLNLPCYFLYGSILTGIAYPFLSRWGWYQDGWLKQMGMRDFGGSGVVHLFGGSCAFVAAWIIGPRMGRFQPKQSKPTTPIHQQHGHTISGHSIPFVGLGGLLLWFGFLGFNAGSQLSISKEGDGPIITYSAFNTLLSASAGALSALFLNRFLPFWGNYWSYIALVNGGVAGMAAACAGCDALPTWAALVTGLGAGAVFILLRSFMEKMEVDDPIDAFAVHFGGGFFGMVSAPFLVRDGIFLKGDHQSTVVLGCNSFAVIVIICWAVIWCCPLFGFLNWMRILRVSPELELAGMDLAKHNEESYPRSSWEEPRPVTKDGMEDVDHSHQQLQPLPLGMAHRKTKTSLQQCVGRSIKECSVITTMNSLTGKLSFTDNNPS